PIAVARKAYRRRRLADAEVPERHLGQPGRQVRIDQQRIQRRVGVEAEERLHETQYRGRGPRLRRIRLRIERGERMIGVARVAAEELREAMEVEQPRRLELRPRQTLGGAVQAVADEAEHEARLLDRPHGAAMVAVRIERRVLRRERTDTPAAEEIGSEQTVGSARRALRIDDAGRQTMAGIGSDRTDETPLGVQTEGIE